MKQFLRTLTLSTVVLFSLQLTGCASLSMSPPKAAIENAAKLRATPLTPVAVDNFKLAPGKPASMDQSISLRGANSLVSPVNNSFARYLQESLRVELESAGLLDPQAATRISGTLTNSEADPAMGTGTARLGARFVVSKANTVRYDRQLDVEAQWESSFMGAVAIPLAAGQYEGLYRKLVGKLIDDPDFIQALKN